MSCLAYCLGRTPGAPAQSASLVNRASSPNTFAGHGPLAQLNLNSLGPQFLECNVLPPTWLVCKNHNLTAGFDFMEAWESHAGTK